LKGSVFAAAARTASGGTMLSAPRAAEVLRKERREETGAEFIGEK
jgi:hypothetical protein